MLRSQDVRTQGDPTSLDGTIARIDPDTGNAPADNPMKDFAGADSNTKRIVATGFRNPFRMTFRPGHSDLYVGDVGQNTWEEVDRFTMSGSTPTNIPNFGWPCYEGAVHQQAFEDVGTDMCASLYAQGATGPLYKYTHIGTLTPKGPCFPGSADQTSSISGLAFYEGASGASIDYPSKYDGALFFVDYSRDCLGAILPQDNGIPDAGKVEQIASGIGNPVDIVTGPGGDLYYVDHNGGRVVRVKYVNAPIARATANPDGGQAPISIHLDGVDRQAIPIPTSPSTAGTGTSSTTAASTTRASRWTGRSTRPASTRSSCGSTAPAASPTRSRSTSTPTTRRLSP